MTALLVAFLLAHGFVHLAVWLPRPAEDAPFSPDHSAVLTAGHVPAATARALAIALAAGTAATYVLAAAAVGVEAGWAPAAAAAAALLGLLLKVLYFNPWLLLGIALDGLVLSAALTEWPVALT